MVRREGHDGADRRAMIYVGRSGGPVVDLGRGRLSRWRRGRDGSISRRWSEGSTSAVARVDRGGLGDATIGFQAGWIPRFPSCLEERSRKVFWIGMGGTQDSQVEVEKRETEGSCDSYPNTLYGD